MRDDKYNFSIVLEYEDTEIGALSVTTRGVVPASDIFAAMVKLKDAFGESIGVIVNVELDLIEEYGVLGNETLVDSPWIQ